MISFYEIKIYFKKWLRGGLEEIIVEFVIEEGMYPWTDNSDNTSVQAIDEKPKYGS